MESGSRGWHARVAEDRGVSSSELLFWDAVDGIRETEARYRREAYGFVVAALGTTVQALPPERLADPALRHLTGGELLRGLVRLARQEFGVLGPTVFREWGVLTGEDIGRIVFRLVECGELSARPEDSLDDFRDFDLFEGLTTGLEIGSLRGARDRRSRPRPAADDPGPPQ
jgi:uncharacterized repeat protein (TIGR04138 family)